ncbi:hypothetical protein DPMN_193740 [Dreissena polymorpha]|uniref:Fe-S hydro-lyase tartrate dehydratase beta-type catalytic domain-containing protein n=1 Tax=Dreissena polymorpha TaxID=45954 RepID=A0A9D3XY83_DREPO|nr:hypothetical protein DPMN_193740 [Dreissena polymorpha]
MNLNQPMSQVLKLLNGYPIKTRLSLTGTLILARDIAHAKLQERLDKREGMPEYMKKHPVYYAGLAKTPEISIFRGLMHVRIECQPRLACANCKMSAML